MITRKFSNTGVSIQVGGLDTANSQTKTADTTSAAFATDKIVEVQDASGSGGWIDVGTSPTASTDSGAFIPPNGITRPFFLRAGHRIEGTMKINIRPLDT